MFQLDNPGIAHVGTPWWVGSKIVHLIYIKNSAHVHARGLLDLAWGDENYSSLVEDPHATSRCRTGIKALSLDNMVTTMYYICLIFSHVHLLHILSTYYDSRVLSIVPLGGRRKSPRALDVCSYNITAMVYVCMWEFLTWIHLQHLQVRLISPNWYKASVLQPFHTIFTLLGSIAIILMYPVLYYVFFYLH